MKKQLFFIKKKNYQESIRLFETAELYAPESMPLLENLSKAYLSTQQISKAITKLKLMISLEKEGNEIAYKLLFEIFFRLEDYEEIKKLLIKVKGKNKISAELELKARLFYPRFFNSLEESKTVRKHFENEINDMVNNKDVPKLKISETILKPPNFELYFDGHNNFLINKRLTRLYKKIYPELYSVPKSNDYKKSLVTENSKINIGFISEFFTDHSIMKLYQGIIFNINKKLFNVFVFHSDKTKNGNRFKQIMESIVLYDYENIILPKDFYDKIEIIRSKKLDILFYTDVHLSSNLYYLTFVKLARFHITSIGHGDTTGNDKMNFFLSSKYLEKDGYEDRYSEKVLLTKLLPIYYYKPNVSNILDKNQLSKKNIYSCPQSAFKILPDFDIAVKKILEIDQKAVVVFIKDRNEHLNEKLFNRFKKLTPTNINRIKFIDRLKPEEYINHCGSASVLLSPFWVGSGNSFMDSMYYGTPTISKPSSFSRSNWVYAGYKQMKIENPPIAQNIDDYVSIAIELANSKDLYDLKNHYREQANKYLFENIKAIEEIENIFLDILN